ncbi:MAG: acyl carrier protein [Sphingobacteriales bacterium]|nr:MAG: acyl carrier protein [Sphingobacteriales bacterium]
MTKQEVISQFDDIFRDQLDNDDITVNENTTAKDIEEWDSLSHVQLIVAIEKKFKVKFTSKEIQCWQNVGQMADTVVSKL